MSFTEAPCKSLQLRRLGVGLARRAVRPKGRRRRRKKRRDGPGGFRAEVEALACTAPIDLCRREITQRLVRAVFVVIPEIRPQPSNQIMAIRLLPQVNLFVLHCAPKTFRQDVVKTAAPAGQADLNATLPEDPDKLAARVLLALIRMKDPRRR